MIRSHRKLRVAVIGCGTQGRIHLDSYSSIPDVEVVACCEVDSTRLERAASDFGNLHAYSDYHDLLRSEKPDLISVCTMPVTHRDIVVAGLSAGANVLCEKPMAMNSIEAGEMIAAAETAQRVLSVGYNMRFMGSAQFAKKFVSEGKLGIPQYARISVLANDIPWWGRHYVRAISGGGVLASTAVHVLDLLLWVINNPEPLTVSATMLRRFPERRGETAPSAEARRAYDVEDLLSAHIRLAGGMALTLEAAWAYDTLTSRYSFELSGSKGLLRFDPLTLVAEKDGRPVEVTPPGVADTDWQASVRREIADVVDALRFGRLPVVRAQEALQIQRLSDALYQSATMEREIRLPGT